MIVPIDAELLDSLLDLAEAHVRRIEAHIKAQRTTTANREVKKQCRAVVQEARELWQEYTDVPAHLQTKRRLVPATTGE